MKRMSDQLQMLLSSLILEQNKLKCLPNVGHFQPSLLFQGTEVKVNRQNVLGTYAEK